MATDPVCGMTVKPESPHRCEYHSVEYRFCSAKCLAKFQASRIFTLNHARRRLLLPNRA